MIYAIIDIGSNTIRMAVYNVQNGQMEMLIKKKYTIGLGAYIENKRMSSIGIDKACNVLNKFKIFLNNFKIDNVSAFATAALRNIDNSEQAVSEIFQRTGVQVRIISGEEEAEFDFIGAIKSMQLAEGIIVDIGGASTEIVVYRNKRILKSVSIEIGSLTMYKQQVARIIPTLTEAENIRQIAKHELKLINFPPINKLAICGIGGTFKALWQLNTYIMDIEPANREIIGNNLSIIINKLISNEKNLYIPLEILIDAVPERVKTVIPGMLIAEVIVEMFNSNKIIYSDSGVREGYLYSLIGEKK